MHFREMNMSVTGKSVSMLAVLVAVTAVFLVGCDSAGSGGGGGGGGDSTTCTATGDYTVTWEFSGTYSDSVTVTTTWVKPSGEVLDPSDPKYGTVNPSSGTLLTETLPACSGASINLITGDGADDDDTVTLTNVTLSISVDGTVADSVVLNGTYPDATLLPNGDALTIVVQ